MTNAKDPITGETHGPDAVDTKKPASPDTPSSGDELGQEEVSFFDEIGPRLKAIPTVAWIAIAGLGALLLTR